MYGHSIMNKEKHSKVKFLDLDKASKAVNDPYFIDLEEYDESTFEVGFNAFIFIYTSTVSDILSVRQTTDRSLLSLTHQVYIYQ